MADIIQLLPDHVANQIAAGEVVQRPASVVKELLENAIDAGATTVKLLVKNAGKTLIQVIDDGKGMSVTDARLVLSDMQPPKLKLPMIYSTYIPKALEGKHWRVSLRLLTLR